MNTKKINYFVFYPFVLFVTFVAKSVFVTSVANRVFVPSWRTP